MLVSLHMFISALTFTKKSVNTLNIMSKYNNITTIDLLFLIGLT